MIETDIKIAIVVVLAVLGLVTLVGVILSDYWDHQVKSAQLKKGKDDSSDDE